MHTTTYFMIALHTLEHFYHLLQPWPQAYGRSTFFGGLALVLQARGTVLLQAGHTEVTLKWHHMNLQSRSFLCRKWVVDLISVYKISTCRLAIPTFFSMRQKRQSAQSSLTGKTQEGFFAISYTAAIVYLQGRSSIWEGFVLLNLKRDLKSWITLCRQRREQKRKCRS